ncbi:hypothetical protein ACFL5O_07605 [Myxococcota bacterium]
MYRRPTRTRRVLRFLRRALRTLLVLAAALGPAPPPPPRPWPQEVTNQESDDSQGKED